MRLRIRVFALCCAAFSALAGGRAALAGTTGTLSGTVTDAQSHQPLAGAVVNVASPSQTASTTTNDAGRFVFLSLSPDTYLISAQREGYDSVSIGGISVFADQTQSLAVTLQKSLKQIGHVTSRSSLNVVKPGTTTDVYSVGQALTQAASPLGGGGGLNNVYSAIASMPGAFVPPGQMGVNQTVYIRGGYYDQIGYEYDGVPVNRSFDNYPAYSGSTLGQQELQIYTGGGGAGGNATGLAGFINQVVRNGTYPGFGTLTAQIGAPTFYHDLQFEVGGATPSRLFSYYAGFSGQNQAFRYLDQQNGGDLGNVFPYATGPSNLTTLLPFYPAMYPTCNPNASAPNNPGLFSYNPGCFSAFNPDYSNISLVEDRQAIVNLHFGIPHHRDGGKDDVQVLYTSSAQYRQYYSSVNDAGAPFVNGLVAQQDISRPPHWPDYPTYPSGTSFLAPADATPVAYLFPGSPQDRCANIDGVPATLGACPNGTYSLLPNDYRDGRWDTSSILKLQYQKNIGSRAYLRVFGYTFYSDTNRSGATRRGIGSGFGATNYDYEVDSHTRGAQAQFADQIGDHNNLTAMLNYVTATTHRLNNYNYLNSSDFSVSNLTNGSECFASRSGYGDNGIDFYNAGQRAPCNDSISQGTFAAPTLNQPQNCSLPIPPGGGGSSSSSSSSGGAPIPAAACSAGAAWRLTYLGNQGAINDVTPTFTSGSINDLWRPSDKVDVNIGVRFENDAFDLASTQQPGKNFWFSAAQQEYCYNPVTLQPVFVPQAPQNASVQIPYVSFNCPVDKSTGTPVQTVHPDGLNGHILLSNQYPSTYSQTYVLPRVGATYTINPDTVLRFSAGRYAQQPQNYEIQYNSIEPNLANQLIGFIPYGFDTPFHASQAQYSNNYDFSYERRFKGTDMSVKVTPYYRYATNQLYTVSVYGLSPALNTGVESSSGVELEFTKGDFEKDGWSGVFSYTYLNSKERWNNYQNTSVNPVDPYNQDIQQYDALTKGGGGAQCYANDLYLYGGSSSSSSSSAGAPPNPIVPDPSCKPYTYVDSSSGQEFPYNPPIRNPYYNMPYQPLFDRNAWYDTGLDYPYLSPNVFSFILNYRHGKFAVTPALTLNEGSTYGNPADTTGIDPRTCTANNASIGAKSGDPLHADYTSCNFAATPSGSLYIPNPATGQFDGFGQFRQPWQLNLGLQLNYQLTPKVSLNLIATNLVNSCFGGSNTPWSRQYAPSSTVCGYISNYFYVSNFWNGSGPNDRAANGVALNPYFAQPFVPAYGDTNSYNYPLPFQLFLSLQVKL